MMDKDYRAAHQTVILFLKEKALEYERRLERGTNPEGKEYSQRSLQYLRGGRDATNIAISALEEVLDQ
jgi:hypothetical protein